MTYTRYLIQLHCWPHYGWFIWFASNWGPVTWMTKITLQFTMWWVSLSLSLFSFNVLSWSSLPFTQLLKQNIFYLEVPIILSDLVLFLNTWLHSGVFIVCISVCNWALMLFGSSERCWIFFFFSLSLHRIIHMHSLQLEAFYFLQLLGYLRLMNWSRAHELDK